MNRLLLASGLLAAGLLSAAPPVRPGYQPDPKLWRLEVGPGLGGWAGSRQVTLRVKVVDPRDPEPPKEDGRRRDFGYEDGDAGDGDEARTPDDWRELQRKREAEAARQAWRNRVLRVWFNGSAMTWTIRVGHTQDMDLQAHNGENRLELLEPDSGQRVVRTWWVSTARTRLRIQTLQSEGEWASGSLQVTEPDGAFAEGGRRTPSGGQLRWSGEYTHETPPPGTYALRWSGGWRGGRPARVRVEVLLDGGTDQERRWTFERLILPGAGPVDLGSFDVEP